jgi:hypothetical protein
LQVQLGDGLCLCQHNIACWLVHRRAQQESQYREGPVFLKKEN